MSLKKLEKFLEEKNYRELTIFCKENSFTNLEYILLRNFPELDKNISKVSETLSTNKTIKIKLLCNWCPSEELMRVWNKMSKGNYRWNNIELTTSNNPDYFVVVNHTTEPHDKKRTFVFRMEPYMHKNPQIWGEWASPDEEVYLKVFRHEVAHNNIEWHLSKTYNELLTFSPVKKYNVLSTVLSSKYRDPGQMSRIDFVKFLEKKEFEVHVYGDNKWNYKNYKGNLPYHQKDDALFPYKYTFNAENNSIPNYFTEKLIDGILAECLVFYSGPDNISSYIDPRAFVRITFSNFEKDYQTVKQAIENNLYEERLPFIREAKKKILNELQFFPRLEKEISELKKLENK